MRVNQIGGYAKFKAESIRRLLRRPFVAIVVHWTFQSLLYMDSTERWFKIGLDVVLTIGFGAILSIWFPWLIALVAAFLVSHTLNFLFNGHLWGVLKHYGLVDNTYEAFHSYTQGFIARAQHEPYIQRVAIYGSLSRQQWSSSSDLDVRLVRNPGLINGARTCWFVLCERSCALIARFPLDIYVLDNDASLRKLSIEEKPLEFSNTLNYNLGIVIDVPE